MNQSWPTKEKDLQVAQMIMEEYALRVESSELGLFEIVVNQQEKRMNYRLSGWVVRLAQYYADQYGEDQGDFVTRQVLSQCIIKGETMH